MPLIAYSLLVDNLPAPASLIDVIDDIEVEADVAMASILRLRVRISLDESGTRWQVLDDDVFTRLASIQLLVTIGAGLPNVVFDGYVTEVEATMMDADSGASWLNVIAMDATAIMNLEEQARDWPNMTDSLIAMQIFAEHGLIPLADPTVPPRIQTDTTVVQRDTDIRFLRSLARRNGFDVFVNPTLVPSVVEGHFHPPRVDFPPQGVLTVAMNDVNNAGGFVFKNEMLRPTTTVAHGVDARTVEAQDASESGTALTELGRSSLHSGDRPRSVFLQPGGLAQTGELQSAAQGSVDRSSWAVTATCLVDSYQYGGVIRPGATILVRGTGSTVSGTYFVEKVRHTFEGENHGHYRQHVTLRRNAVAAIGTELYITDLGLPV
jgi:hypothetical protein